MSARTMMAGSMAWWSLSLSVGQGLVKPGSQSVVSVVGSTTPELGTKVSSSWTTDARQRERFLENVELLYCRYRLQGRGSSARFAKSKSRLTQRR